MKESESKYRSDPGWFIKFSAISICCVAGLIFNGICVESDVIVATTEKAKASEKFDGSMNIYHVQGSINTAGISAAGEQEISEREFTIQKRYILLPVKTNPGRARTYRVALLIENQIEREFDIELSDSPEWYAHLDVGKWKTRKAVLRAYKLPRDSRALELVEQSDSIWNASELYKERLRAQLHFSPARGWNNDPNGLVYANGEYHLYFQHNPYGWHWGNMHWGHAVSKDLVHWKELDIAIYPIKYNDWVFSGSAVVDYNNTSGWRTGENELIVAAFTSTGRGECVVYSNDRGRSFKEFELNPIVKHSGRDPRLLWHQDSKQWVMAVYDEFENQQWIAFYTSTDLKSWTFQSRIKGFYECPDIFMLSGKWILTAANSDYMIGNFDGKVFTPETPKLKGHRGRGFYAAQTFSNEPKGRVVQIGWLQVQTPGMPFNQAMSLPMELKLKQTPDGWRLSWQVVEEYQTLRKKHYVKESLADCDAELVEFRAEFEAADITFKVRGITIQYDPTKQELIVNNHRASAPAIDGKQRITVFVDRVGVEIFASDGLTYIPMPIIPEPNNRKIEIIDPSTKLISAEAYALKSIWE